MAYPDSAAKDNLLERLDAAAVDGRARNVRYRQDQLHLLHRFLKEHADDICRAMCADEDCLREDAELEFYLSMTTVEEIYQQLNFEENLDKEYAVTKQENNIGRRMPYGLVLIRPGTFTRMYSIFSALAAAMGAGNCVVIEVSQNRS